MSDVRIELNREGVRELLRSEEMKTICSDLASQEARKLGKGYKVSAFRGRNRVNASVYTDDPKLIQDNLENNTMLKVIGTGRKA